MKSKVISLSEVGNFVDDGDVVLVHGLALLARPMALIREVIKAGRRDLTVIDMLADIGADMLCAAGSVSTIMYSYLSLWYFGMAPNFRRMAESGEVNAEEHVAIVIDKMIEAGIQGVPFLPLIGPYGSDSLTRTAHGLRDVKMIPDPFSGEETMVARALYPDVALVHAHRADPEGNVQYGGGHSWLGHNNLARKTIVSVEQIVSSEHLRREPDSTILPSIAVKAVVEAPFGAHPTACPGYYSLDAWHFEEYVDTAQTAEGTRAYLDQYVYGPPTHGDYLVRIGLKRLLTLQRLQGEGAELRPGALETELAGAAT